VLGGRASLEHGDGPIEAFEVDSSEGFKCDVFEQRRLLRDAGCDENLSCACPRTEAGGDIERRPAVAVLHGDRLTAVDSYPDREGELAFLRGGLPACILKLEPCANCLRRRLEHRQGFVASELDHSSAPRLDSVPRKLGELRRQASGGGVPVLPRERRVPPDVRSGTCAPADATAP
jgi:hypothetical protein